MIEKSTIQRVLERFFAMPTTEQHMRQIARDLKLSHPTILNAIETLKRERLVTTRRQGPLLLARAAIDNPWFLRFKRTYNLESLYVSGLVDELSRTLRPDTIVCFGSYSRGDDTERSDIDIAIVGGNDKESDLVRFERILHRPISLHRIRSGKLAENLKNGIVLEGAL